MAIQKLQCSRFEGEEGQSKLVGHEAAGYELSSWQAEHTSQ